MQSREILGKSTIELKAIYSTAQVIAENSADPRVIELAKQHIATIAEELERREEGLGS